jgi:hypothetical protein
VERNLVAPPEVKPSSTRGNSRVPRPLIEKRFESMQEFVSQAVTHYAQQQLKTVRQR